MRVTDLSKSTLLQLLREYDIYIQSANDDNQYSTGWKPVSIKEFLNNEFQDLTLSK